MQPGNFQNTRLMILFILLSNVLFGMIPAFAIPFLEEHPGSIMFIVFARFLFGGLFFLVLLLLQLGLHAWNKRFRRAGSSFFQTTWRDLKGYLLSRNRAFFNKPRLLYLFVISFFGVTVNVITYFLGLETLSVTIMLVAGPGGSIIIISLYNAFRGYEKFTLFKLIYIFLMILSLFLVTMASGDARAGHVTSTGIVSLAINLLSLFILFVYMGRDSYAREEEIVSRPASSNYKLARTFLKIAVFMLFGAFSVWLLVPVGILFPGNALGDMVKAFIQDLPYFWTMALDWKMTCLVLVSTVLSNLFLFIPATFWDTEHALSLDQWNSILYLVDPIFSTTISVLLGFEAVEPNFMALTILILVISILLRFIHERDSKLNVVIFINVKFGKQREIIHKLAEYDGIRKYYWLAGIADLMIKATFGSLREYYNFVAELGMLPDVKILFDHLAFINKTIS